MTVESRTYVKDTGDQLLAAQLGQKQHYFEFWIERDILTSPITFSGLSVTLLAPNFFSNFFYIVFLPRLDFYVWLSVDRLPGFFLVDSFFQEQLNEEQLRPN